MKPKAPTNPKRRRGMRPRRTFDELAADISRFDFSSRAGANDFYCHALKAWTAGEIVFMAQMSPRIVPDENWARATETLDELRAEAYAEMKSAARIGYLGATPNRLDPLTEKTIRELQAAQVRNQHPRKRTGPDGCAVTKTEAADALGISRPALYALLRNPGNAWELSPAHLGSWTIFRRYLDTHAGTIDAHRASKRKRKRRPDIRLTKTGRIETAPARQPPM